MANRPEGPGKLRHLELHAVAMILICPSCASSQELARAALGETGLQVRCPQCRVSWFASAHRAMPQSTHADLSGTGEEREAGATGWVRRLFHLSTVLACVLLACGTLMTAVAKRQAIVRALPALARIYAAFGLPIDPRGLALRNVKSTLLSEGAGHVLAIQGEIANLRSDALAVPPLHVALRGADGRDMYTWTAAAPKARLAAGETVAFRTRLAAPPEGARQVVIEFAAAADATHPEEHK